MAVFVVSTEKSAEISFLTSFSQKSGVVEEKKGKTKGKINLTYSIFENINKTTCYVLTARMPSEIRQKEATLPLPQNPVP